MFFVPIIFNLCQTFPIKRLQNPKMFSGKGQEIVRVNRDILYFHNIEVIDIDTKFCKWLFIQIAILGIIFNNIAKLNLKKVEVDGSNVNHL